MVVVVASYKGICSLRIGSDEPALIQAMLAEFPDGQVVRNDTALAEVLSSVQDIARGRPTAQLPTDVPATDFQARVWAALRTIPLGEQRTYAQVAAQIGSPTAVRAVARACATNPVALVVPCHRVIRSDGHLAGYRWGLAVKRALLDHERVSAIDSR